MPGIIFAIVMLVGARLAFTDPSLPPAARQAKAFGRVAGVAVAVAVFFIFGPTVVEAAAHNRVSPLAFTPYVALLLGEIFARVASERIAARSSVRLVTLSSKGETKEP